MSEMPKVQIIAHIAEVYRTVRRRWYGTIVGETRRESMKAVIGAAIAALSVATIGVTHSGNSGGIAEMKRSKLK